MSLNDCDNDGQLEKATCPPKPAKFHLNSKLPELKAAFFIAIYNAILQKTWLFCVLPKRMSYILLLKMYFRFGRPYCYFRLPIVVAVIWEDFLWTRHVENSRFAAGGNAFVVFLIKRTGFFFTPNAIRARKNKSAIRGLKRVYDLVIILAGRLHALTILWAH